MVDINTDMHYVDVKLEITKTDGTPAIVDGVPVWASSDETVMMAKDISVDGMSAASIEFLTAGTAKMVVTADADLGAGIIPIVGETEEHIVTIGTSGQAKTMKIVLGAAVPKV